MLQKLEFTFIQWSHFSFFLSFNLDYIYIYIYVYWFRGVVGCKPKGPNFPSP